MIAHSPAAPRPLPTAHRPWPTPQDYNEALQHPALNFADPVLRSGTPELTPLGLPRAITGGFASVYRLRCGNESWAVRCFLRDVPDQQQCYAAIGRHLATARLPAMVPFAYQADGIRVGGRPYPILRMAWLEGETLDRWIARHLGDPAALRALDDRWVALLRALRRAGVAHGDLQHGNILVVGDELRLIDYDGLYVPALAGRAATEVGHRNYQHPRRGPADFGPQLDHFAAWSIALSLRALAIEPGLWQRLGAGDEALLLRREDYLRPDASPALAAIAALPDPAVRALATRFRSLLDLDVAHLPPLDGTEPRRAARGVAPVRPVRAPAPPVGAASWLADHLPTPPPRKLAASLRAERALLGGGAALLVAPCAGVIGGFCTPGAALAVAALVVAAVALAWLGRFLALPTTPGLLIARRRVALARAHVLPWTLLDRGLTRWQAHLDALATAQLAALAEQRRERARATRAALGAVKQELARFDAERQCQRTTEADDLTRALHMHQQHASATYLRSFAILDANLPALGAQASLHLLKAGIRTAADFADVRVSRPSGGGALVEIEKPGHGFVPIAGLTGKGARALLEWQRALLAVAGSAIPIALPPEREAAIRLRHHTRAQTLERRAESAARRAAQQETAIRERAAAERAAFKRRAAAIRRDAARTRARHAVRRERTQARLAAANLTLTLARREAAAYAAVGVAPFLRAIVGLPEQR